jgi:hypothetical protein
LCTAIAATTVAVARHPQPELVTAAARAQSEVPLADAALPPALAYSRSVEWTKDEVLAVVVRALTGRAPSSWIFDRATVVGHEVQVVFHLTSGEPGRFAVVYSLEPFQGPNTGITPTEPPGLSLQDWANEIAWDLDENTDTGGLLRAGRFVGEDGVVVLTWRG